MNMGDGVKRTVVGTRADSAPREALETATTDRDNEIRRILGLTVPVTVSLAEREMAVESILAIKAGTIIEFEVPFDSELTLHVANRPIGRGHAVKHGENFGLKVSQIEPLEERIDALGGVGGST